MNRLRIFIIVSLLGATHAIAQQISSDSLYPKGTWGIEYRYCGGLAYMRQLAFHPLIINGLGVTYFFSNRWAANLSGMYKPASLGRFQNGDYFNIDMSVRYHLTNVYFGTMIDYKNKPMVLNEKNQLQRSSAGYAIVGLHQPFSYHKKYWRNIFYVAQIGVGSVLYAETPIQKGIQGGELVVNYHVGLQYLIRPRK